MPIYPSGVDGIDPHGAPGLLLRVAGAAGGGGGGAELSASHLGTGAGGTSVTIEAVTPLDSSIVLVTVISEDGSTGVSGLGLTWALVESGVFGGIDEADLWVGTGTISAPDDIVVTTPNSAFSSASADSVAGVTGVEEAVYANGASTTAAVSVTGVTAGNPTHCSGQTGADITVEDADFTLLEGGNGNAMSSFWSESGDADFSATQASTHVFGLFLAELTAAA